MNHTDSDRASRATTTVYRSGTAFWVAVIAACLALALTVGAPLAAYGGSWDLLESVPHSHLLTALSAIFPLLALAGVLVWWGRRHLRQATVWIGGLGTCLVCVAWVLLSGPHHVAFAPIPDGAMPGQMAGSALLGAAAALTMMVADQIAWRHAARAGVVEEGRG